MRLCACLGVEMDIIEPCGFPLDDTRLRRAAMDYREHLALTRHRSWEDFEIRLGARRLVLITTKTPTVYTAFSYRPDDILMVGRESAGVPPCVHDRADARIVIPMKPPLRSLNVALSAAMVLGEALRQTATERPDSAQERP